MGIEAKNAGYYQLINPHGVSFIGNSAKECYKKEIANRVPAGMRLINFVDGYDELEALKDLAIWMSGCGYDFAKHEYFIQNRHLLEGLGGQDDKQ